MPPRVFKMSWETKQLFLLVLDGNQWMIWRLIRIAHKQEPSAHDGLHGPSENPGTHARSCLHMCIFLRRREHALIRLSKMSVEREKRKERREKKEDKREK